MYSDLDWKGGIPEMSWYMMHPIAHKSEARDDPRDVKISGETYSGVPTKELRLGFGGPAHPRPSSSSSSSVVYSEKGDDLSMSQFYGHEMRKYVGKRFQDTI